MTDPARERGLRLAWGLFVVVAGSMAILALLEWSDALISGRPILYGEGAIAHAAILFRDGSAYRDAGGTVAANYPPLFLAIASLGDPFRVGRAATIAATLMVAILIAWRSRPSGLLAPVGLGVGWLALAPVAIWGAAVKPDLVAVALTFGGVVLLDRSRGGGAGAFAAGALLEAALWTKPTAALPAIAVIVWSFFAARRALPPLLAGFGVVAAIGLADVVAIGPADVWRHVVVWNVLPWSAEQTALVGVLFVATVGLVLAVAAMSGGLRGIALAYTAGALGIAVLAGREGATINYLLDLAAATSFALATVAPRLRASAALPIAGSVQLVIAVALLTPFGIVPGRAPTTGAWGQPERLEAVKGLGPGTHLVEDSGLLIVEGVQPVIDDLFLWTRLAGQHLIDADPILERARRGEFASVVSEVDLSRLDAPQTPAYERARWHPGLVTLILERYTLERSTGILWIYRPR